MPVRVIDFQAKVCGKTQDVTMHNFIDRDLTFKLVNNPFPLLEIPDVEKTLLPTWKEMHPEWFISNPEELLQMIKKLFDQVDNAVLEAQPKDEYTELEREYASGYREAMDFMRTEMAWIEKKLKEGESPFDYAGKK